MIFSATLVFTSELLVVFLLLLLFLRVFTSELLVFVVVSHVVFGVGGHSPVACELGQITVFLCVLCGPWQCWPV